MKKIKTYFDRYVTDLIRKKIENVKN